MTPSFITTTILKLRKPAANQKIDDFTAIVGALADDTDAATGQSIFWSGDLKVSARPTAPGGWLVCDGSAVSRSGYASLYSAIGVAYGAGDGSSTFNLPDYRGRTIVGAGAGSGLTARSMGGSGGVEAVTLTDAAQNAPHTHPFGTFVLASQGGWASIFAASSGTTYPVPIFNNSYSIDPLSAAPSSGGGESHANMQPFAIANVFIKT